jgi:hypothetical protein
MMIALARTKIRIGNLVTHRALPLQTSSIAAAGSLCALQVGIAAAALAASARCRS